MKKTVEVAAAIIVDGGKFLICQRPPRKARGLLWEFPGGKREAGESLRDAAVREIREELGAVIEPLEVLETTSHEYPDLCVNLTLFKSVIRSGEIALFEHNDMRWIRPSEIPEYTFCPADYEFLGRITDERLA